jgi:hypothetical protein
VYAFSLAARGDAVAPGRLAAVHTVVGALLVRVFHWTPEVVTKVRGEQVLDVVNDLIRQQRTDAY